MKKRNLLLLLYLMVTFSYFSCETESLIGTFTANIGGDNWIATAPGAVKTDSRFTITGIGNNQSIIININGITPGTYTTDVFSGNIQPVIYTPDLGAPQNSYFATSGTIIVDEVTDNRITGTFNVIVTNSLSQNISINGYFTNVIYSI